MRFNPKQIVSYCLGLCTENPGLREVDLEPSSKRGSGNSDKWTKEDTKNWPNNVEAIGRYCYS